MPNYEGLDVGQFRKIFCVAFGLFYIFFAVSIASAASAASAASDADAAFQYLQGAGFQTRDSTTADRCATIVVCFCPVFLYFVLFPVYCILIDRYCSA